MSTIHVLYDGQTKDFDFDTLFAQDRLPGLGIIAESVTPANVSQENIKTAVAQEFDVDMSTFEGYFIENNPNGNITVRPQTTFGGD